MLGRLIPALHSRAKNKCLGWLVEEIKQKGAQYEISDQY